MLCPRLVLRYHYRWLPHVLTASCFVSESEVRVNGYAGSSPASAATFSAALAAMSSC